MSVRCIADNQRKEVYLSDGYGNSPSAWRLRLSLLVCQADNKVGRKPADYPVPGSPLHRLYRSESQKWLSTARTSRVCLCQTDS